jgi:hypothetical protein
MIYCKLKKISLNIIFNLQVVSLPSIQTGAGYNGDSDGDEPSHYLCAATSVHEGEGCMVSMLTTISLRSV